jgi:NAD(P)-dependent dehydrogenase (short-subunit alcohol dehydrogenase family)
MARAFAEKGMNIVLADISADQLEKARNEFGAQDVPVLTLPLDVTDRTSLRAAAEKVVERFGAVHIVCANAGVSGHMGPIELGTDADWDWVIDVNLKGTINTVQAFLPWLMKNDHDGHVVITSSISGMRIHRPSRGQGMYNTTKFGLMGFGEALSLDMEPHGIGVSLICPGIVNTDISNSGRNRPQRYGGAKALNENHELAKIAATGTDPLEFGRWVVRAVELERLFVPTHEDGQEQVEQRHQRISAAFAGIPDLKTESS